jgi:hypothetical protein
MAEVGPPNIASEQTAAPDDPDTEAHDGHGTQRSGKTGRRVYSLRSGDWQAEPIDS